MSNPRQVALEALQQIEGGYAYTDIALDRVLQATPLSRPDGNLVTELVYGCVRRKRTLDALLDSLARKPARDQPSHLRLILQIGLYQLRYLDRIPPSAAVNTSVELAKTNGFKNLAGVVNGILRQYSRCVDAGTDPLTLPEEPISRLGIMYSFPDWIIQLWAEQFGLEETEQLCQWFDRAPSLDLRVNTLKTSRAELQNTLTQTGIQVTPIPELPQGLRLSGREGGVRKLPGFKEGWWTLQSSGAQLVSHLLDPQPGETIIDTCAAPGGKTTHIAELMQDRGEIWACDRSPHRLERVTENAQRLDIQSIKLFTGDSRQLKQFYEKGDRVLVDAPCSGLGTVHRHPDIRWRQTPAGLPTLITLQRELLESAAECVKPGGVLVYATCTLNPGENEAQIQTFLETHPQWFIQAPPPSSPLSSFANPAGWLTVVPCRHQTDGFFIVRLGRKS